MRKLSREEFKERTVNMLIETTKFLEQNNLRYILDYGTLLGCIRHKGYIPWDDDIDISMPREDIEKMYKILKAQDFTINGTLKFADIRNKYSTHTFFNKVIDINTLAEDKLRLKKYRYPIWIDIFPYDLVPKDRKLISKTKEYYDKTVAKAMYPLFPHENQNIAKKVISKLLEPLVDIRLNAIRKRIVSIKKQTKTKYYCNMTMSIKLRKDYGAKKQELADFCYSQKLFDDFIYKDFEGHKFRVPKDYDKRLSDIYGDYMKLPPKEKQVPHTTATYILDKD
jgi:lipopolysaccharide cholinephosphotransferase